MSSLKVSDNTFWVLIGKDLTIFSDRDEAIKTLTGFDHPSMAQLIEFTRAESNQWTIEQVSWKEIASALMRSMKNGV